MSDPRLIDPLAELAIIEQGAKAMTRYACLIRALFENPHVQRGLAEAMIQDPEVGIIIDQINTLASDLTARRVGRASRDGTAQ